MSLFAALQPSRAEQAAQRAPSCSSIARTHHVQYILPKNFGGTYSTLRLVSASKSPAGREVSWLPSMRLGVSERGKPNKQRGKGPSSPTGMIAMATSGPGSRKSPRMVHRDCIQKETHTWIVRCRAASKIARTARREYLVHASCRSIKNYNLSFHVWRYVLTANSAEAWSRSIPKA